jgi:hypothetical protein
MRDTADTAASEVARLRAGLADILANLQGTPCSFWACPGVTGELVPMATCTVCAAQMEITALLATSHVDGAETRPEGERG